MSQASHTVEKCPQPSLRITWYLPLNRSPIFTWWYPPAPRKTESWLRQQISHNLKTCCEWSQDKCTIILRRATSIKFFGIFYTVAENKMDSENNPKQALRKFGKCTFDSVKRKCSVIHSFQLCLYFHNGTSFNNNLDAAQQVAQGPKQERHRLNYCMLEGFQGIARRRTHTDGKHIGFIKREAVYTVTDTARGLISERAADRRDATPLQ